MSELVTAAVVKSVLAFKKKKKKTKEKRKTRQEKFKNSIKDFIV